MLRRFSINFALFSMLLDAFLVSISLWLSTWLRPLMNSLPFVAFIPNSIVIPLYLYFLLPLVWVLVFISFSIYDGRKYLHVTAEFAALSWASFLAAISMAGILYFSYRDISRAEFLLFVFLAYVAFLFWRGVARMIFRLHPENASRKRIVIVGTGELGQMAEGRIREVEGLNQEVVGFVDDSPGKGFGGRVLGPVPRLREIVARHSITDVVIALPPHSSDQTRQIVELLSRLPVKVWVVPETLFLALYRPSMEELNGIPMLDLRASALNDYERITKRSFDVVFGSVAFVLSMPVMVMAMVLIWLEDRGPVIFMQQRVGENEKPFSLIKLRTMVVGAEDQQAKGPGAGAQADAIHKSRDDPRVTRVGRVLRRFSIDELPQLINVLKGDMSLVGPRPELPSLVEAYQPWQHRRFVVPPGMTGWWQVRGRSDHPMHLNTEDDMYYVQNYSLGLDFRILLLTIWVVLVGRGAY